jgi:hypothetical protein
MSTLWTPEVLTDIAQRISTQESIRFWDEDEVGYPQELEKENITRYLNNFLPATASFATIFYAVFATPIDSDRL